MTLLSAGRAWVERLGVHSLEGNECLHGLFNRGSSIQQPNGTVLQYAIDGGVTTFPQSIGMGATFNRSLLWHMGDVISTEAVAKRNEHRRQGAAEQDWPFYLTCWMPVINIARDTRWGRTPETYLRHSNIVFGQLCLLYFFSVDQSLRLGGAGTVKTRC